MRSKICSVTFNELEPEVLGRIIGWREPVVYSLVRRDRMKWFEGEPELLGVRWLDQRVCGNPHAFHH